MRLGNIILLDDFVFKNGITDPKCRPMLIISLTYDYVYLLECQSKANFRTIHLPTKINLGAMNNRCGTNVNRSDIYKRDFGYYRVLNDLSDERYFYILRSFLDFQRNICQDPLFLEVEEDISTQLSNYDKPSHRKTFSKDSNSCK